VADSTSTSRGTNGLVVVAALILVGAGLRAAAPVVVPLLFALFLAIVASAPIGRMRALGVPASLAILIVTGAFLGVGALLSGVVAVSVGELSDSLPEYEARVEAMTASASDWVAGRGWKFGIDDLKRIADPGAAVGVVGEFLSGLGAILANGMLVGFLMIFILLEASSIPVKLAAMTSHPERAQRILEQLRGQIDAYFGVLTLVSAATGLLVYLLLLVLGVDLALLLGLLAFLLNYIPNIGSIIAAVPAVLLALVQLGPGPALLVMLGYLAVNMVMGNIVQPRLMGRDVGLSTLTVFVSMLFWGWLLGPVGMIVAVPLTAAMRLALEANESTRPLAIALGTEEAARLIVEDDSAENRG
jgi:predicted PurR-regulated permease PerM